LQITEVSFIAFIWAFIAGLASFLSPCVLPLLPGYLSFISGVGVDELGARTRKVAIASVAFVAGFTVFFALQGAAAGLAGSALGNFLTFFTSTTGEGKRILEVLAGALLTGFGAFMVGEAFRYRSKGVKYLAIAVFALALFLAFTYAIRDNSVDVLQDSITYLLVGLAALGVFWAGIFPLDFLEKERRLRLLKKPASLVGVVLAGMVFSLGIGPCTGPLLGSVIMLAVGTQSPASGASLMFVYALGMGLPFVLAGFLFARMVSTFDFVKRHFGAIKIASGVLLILFGLILATGEMEILTQWLQKWMPTINV
jgi:cytochrome c-type biogenesis protein